MRPRLHVAGRPELSGMYAAALHTLLDLNVVPARTEADPPRYIRAGGGYPAPWTRDAALNCWDAASVLVPGVAADTLRMVCDVRPDGRRIIAQDDQWWDQIVWVVAAWSHYLATRDEEFLAEAFAIGADSLQILYRDHYRERFGLYAGGSFMQDGISGYPQPPNESGKNSSFVLDYPGSHEIMCLSTNALYTEAHRRLAAMAELLGRDAAPYRRSADSIAAAVNEHLWNDEAGTYGYFLDPAGRLDPHQEAAGLAFAITFGIADESRARSVFERTHREPYGVVNVWPHFAERYSADRPGRHNVMVWPMVLGLFGDAAAAAGRADVLDEVLGDFTRLINGSDGRFFELYHPQTGAVDGGWQCGRQWPSEPDQTWSATAYLRLIHTGLAGLRFRPGGISVRPVLPPGIEQVQLTGLPYRGAVLDLQISGSGTEVAQVRMDGAALPPGAIIEIPAGPHRLEVHCG
jgi:glycogen debranching enzyme